MRIYAAAASAQCVIAVAEPPPPPPPLIEWKSGWKTKMNGGGGGGGGGSLAMIMMMMAKIAQAMIPLLLDLQTRERFILGFLCGLGTGDWGGYRSLTERDASFVAPTSH